MKFSDVLSVLGLAPKNLDEARAALTPAKATLDSVSALFSAAGLNLEAMLAAGPDALKLHLESVSGDDEALAEALLENEQLEKKLSELMTNYTERADECVGLLGALQIIGLPAPTAEAPLTAEAVKTALEAHVVKAAALLLAKTGHPGVKHEPEAKSGGAVVPAPLSRAEFDALTPGAKSRHCLAGGRIAA